MSNKLTQARLKELLNYDRETGVFTWRTTKGSRATAGRPAGWINDQGYRVIQVDRKNMRAHRLAWIYVNGDVLDDSIDIDHVNGRPGDNRIVNLRLATVDENLQNLSRDKVNSSGVVGVYKVRKSGRWAAQITRMYKHYYLGVYGTREEAYAAYLEAKSFLHAFNPVPREAICAT